MGKYQCVRRHHNGLAVGFCSFWLHTKEERLLASLPDIRLFWGRNKCTELCNSLTFSDFQIVTRLLLFNLIPFDIPKLICKYWELLSGRELQIGWPYIAIFNSAQLPTFYEGCFRISTVFLPPITIPSCWRMLINQAFWCCSIFSNLWYSFQWVSVSTFVNNLHIKVNKS